jgi:hypothetical protein
MRWNLFKTMQILIIVAGTLSCTGSNLYKDLASNKESDAALFEDAQKLIDSGDYTGAIAKLRATSTAFQAEARTKESLAGAYAARCGMEFLPFVQNLTSGSSTGLFKLAMNSFVGVDTSNYADCKTAETIVESIGGIDARTQSQNLFLMILELAKLGNRIRANADTAPTSTGDGNVDATYNCKTSVPISDVQEIMSSLYKFIAQFAKVGSTLSGVDNIGDFIDDFGGDLPDLDYSGGTDPAGADEGDEVIVSARFLLNIQMMGVGSCNNTDPLVCFCPP